MTKKSPIFSNKEGAEKENIRGGVAWVSRDNR